MNIPLPKDYMKGRRPSQFSDSRMVSEGKLNRTILEQQLEYLTSRKQEYDFEEFARELCQYEICPNLRPQTGPTGGGDGKIDTETTPLSTQISDTYYYGEEKNNNEKWAFAFSAKKDWRSKVKSDVKKIFETKRGYSKIFFITNQYAKASTRAELEDFFLNEYKINVIIHDRTWILDKVFGNKREKIAIDKLRLGEGLEEKKEIGPNDYKRQKLFDELNVSIENASVNRSITIEVIDNCLNTALISAELDKPKIEVEGLFDRAIKMAEKYGTSDQLFTAKYQKTWTLYFWFNDFNTLLKNYEEIEKIALESNRIYFVERLNNLWMLIHTLSITSSKLIDFDFLNQKTENLKNKLDSIKNDDTNPSAAVNAEAMLGFLSLVINKEKNEETTNIFKDFKLIIDKAENLIGFPFKTTFEILDEMNDVFSGNKAFEDLQEHLVSVVTKREGEISAAEMLLNRGIQHIKAGRYYKAIDCLGRALVRFYKKESKQKLVISLVFLSMAYKDAGLLWAARSALINAASHSTSDFWNYGEINTMQLSCYKSLRELELLLGRIGYTLEWHQLHNIMATQLANTDEEKQKLLEDNLMFGCLLGALIIKTPDDELKILEKLPDTLFAMDIDFAAYGLIYRLGGKDLLPKDFIENLKMKSEEVEDFFNLYLSQPAQESLPEKPSYYENNFIELKSTILGCDYIVKTNNKSPEIEIGEYILAAIESFLSTAIDIGAISRDSSTIISIQEDKSLKKEIKYKIKKDGGKLEIEITCGSFNPHKLTKEEQEKIIKSVSEVVLQIIGYTVIFKDEKVDLLKLFKDEEVCSRAFNFSTPLVSLGNVLGYNPKRAISDWINIENKEYSYSPEKSGKPKKVKDFPKEEHSVKTEDDGLFRHDEIKNVSVIRQHLWDEAGWSGVFYMTMPSKPPVMAFMFTNEKAARAIFKDWIETFGKEDKDNIIRISMIRGISEKNPSWYRAVITTNLDKKNPPKTTRIIVVSRIHTLTPESTDNLDRFSESYNQFGFYLLAPAIVVKDSPYPKTLFDEGIIKNNFNDRQAWEIGPLDLDMAGITDETKPIIPKGVNNPPVVELLKQKNDYFKRV